MIICFEWFTWKSAFAVDLDRAYKNKSSYSPCSGAAGICAPRKVGSGRRRLNPRGLVARNRLSRGSEGASGQAHPVRSEEHTSELQSLMRNSYAVFCLKKKKTEDTVSCCNLTIHN